ncbi:MAG: NADH-quinone oxidoreductase subunit A [Acidimicrobiia bacterium]|nr:NADH-quinone oxidoreductase subunit A [Acidimicrobiia bacterium]
MGLLALIFGGASYVLSGLLAPRKPTPEKLQPYECGIVPEYEPPQRFPVQFYLIAVIFIAFDIEVIFMYPWAVRMRDLGMFGFALMGSFMVMLIVPLIYIIREGVLDWAPRRRHSRDELIARYRAEHEAAAREEAA